MKLSALTISKLTRETRVALLVAFLIAVGTICLSVGWRTTGLLSLLSATSISAAFYFFAIRPSRMPRDAVLTLRLAGGIREDAPRSPLEQLRSRGAVTLFDIRNVLEAATTDSRLRGVLVEVCGPGF